MYGALIFLIAFIVYWLQRNILKRLLVKTTHTPFIWDDTLLQALSLPLTIFVWIYAIFIFMNYALLELYQKKFALVLPSTQKRIFILVLIWFFWRYMRKIEYRLTHPKNCQSKKYNTPVDFTTLSVIGKFIRIALISIGILTILDT